jgi:DNA-binding response OmpR family regulator
MTSDGKPPQNKSAPATNPARKAPKPPQPGGATKPHAPRQGEKRQTQEVLIRPLVLAVDDDRETLSTYERVFQRINYRFIGVDSVRAGLAVLEKQIPDLIVCDIVMPESFGYDLCVAVRENPTWHGIPFMFASAKGLADDIARGMALGADDYVVLPFDLADFVTRVRGLVKKSARLRPQT